MQDDAASTAEVALAWGSASAADALADDMAWLSASERRRLARIAAPRRAAQFVAGRKLARALLVRRYGDAARCWQLTAQEGEPPRVAGSDRVHLSLAHTGDLVVCALAGCPIGIDIERVDAHRDRAALLAAIASPAEREQAEAASGLPPSWLALHLWTLKEAWIKLAGGELFATMLGHRVSAMPASPGDADAVSWMRGDVVVALALDRPVAALASADIGAESAHYWRLRPAPRA